MTRHEDPTIGRTDDIPFPLLYKGPGFLPLPTFDKHNSLTYPKHGNNVVP